MINCYGAALEMISVSGNPDELLDEYARIRNSIHRIYQQEEIEKAIERTKAFFKKPPETKCQIPQEELERRAEAFIKARAKQ